MRFWDLGELDAHRSGTQSRIADRGSPIAHHLFFPNHLMTFLSMKTLRTLAFAAVALAFGLIVLGAVVRITGSGMGCGDDWPLCNGRLIPSLDDPATLIEWGHRQVAALLSILVLAVAAYAYWKRKEAGGPGGPLRSALLAVVLLVVQVLLGAVTVWLELPPAAVVLHLSVAMALVAALHVTGLRAGDGASPRTGAARGAVMAAAGLGAVIVLFGGLTANLFAGPSCQGFPLCNGQFWPDSAGSGLPHIHWTHRLLAYALLFHLGGLCLGLRRKRAPERIQGAAWFAFGLTVAQVVVAAIMVLALLPPMWRAMHAAVGTALWIALVYLVWVSRGNRLAITD